jgi:CheY-like chemotaxis protein
LKNGPVRSGGARGGVPTNGQGNGFVASSVRVPSAPPVRRRIWILVSDPARAQVALEVLQNAGHEARTGEPGVDLAPALKEYRPDVIVIDMQDQPDRNRHAAVQLRQDRTTRQLPIILVGLRGEEGAKTERAVQGPTRRYAHSLDEPSVLNSLVCDL